MTLKITTTYHNVDKAWLSWWFRKNGPNYGLIGFNPSLPHKFASKDPTSEVWSETIIEAEDRSTAEANP